VRPQLLALSVRELARLGAWLPWVLLLRSEHL
jgi:hypothetical protein